MGLLSFIAFLSHGYSSITSVGIIYIQTLNEILLLYERQSQHAINLSLF